jgi:hypothetical protein
MASRLHARTDYCQNRCIWNRQVPDRDCRGGCCPHLGDVPAVHGGEQSSGMGIEQDDGGQVRRKALACVLMKNRD